LYLYLNNNIPPNLLIGGQGGICCAQEPLNKQRSFKQAISLLTGGS